MLSCGYVMHRLFMHVRMASSTVPNLQCSLDPNGVDAIEFMGVKS